MQILFIIITLSNIRSDVVNWSKHPILCPLLLLTFVSVVESTNVCVTENSWKKRKKTVESKTTIILYSKNQNVTCRKLNIVRSIWPLHHQSIYQLRENKQLKCIECAKYSLNRLKINSHRKKVAKKTAVQLLYYTLHTSHATRAARTPFLELRRFENSPSVQRDSNPGHQHEWHSDWPTKPSRRILHWLFFGH